MTLGLLVGRFGEFVRGTHAPAASATQTPELETPMPDAERRVREACAHHIIPLLLLSRVDGESAEAERQAIVTHCLSLLKRKGLPAGVSERTALAGQIAGYKPVLMQLDPALKRVEQDGADAVHRLVAAAIQVVEADGKRDPAEMKFLNTLSEDLAKL